jgi:hypothetical protein
MRQRVSSTSGFSMILFDKFEMMSIELSINYIANQFIRATCITVTKKLTI